MSPNQGIKVKQLSVALPPFVGWLGRRSLDATNRTLDPLAMVSVLLTCSCWCKYVQWIPQPELELRTYTLTWNVRHANNVNRSWFSSPIALMCWSYVCRLMRPLKNHVLSLVLVWCGGSDLSWWLACCANPWAWGGWCNCVRLVCICRVCERLTCNCSGTGHHSSAFFSLHTTLLHMVLCIRDENTYRLRCYYF